MARAMSKTLHAAARFRGSRARIRGTQSGKLTAAMRLGDFGKYFHQIGTPGELGLDSKPVAAVVAIFSYHNAAALWLYRRLEMGYHAAGRRHALAAFGADTSLNMGQPFRRGTLGERSARGSVDGSSVGFCAGPAGHMRVRRRGGNGHAHRIDRFRGLCASAAGNPSACGTQSRSQGGAQGSACTETG